MIKNRKGYLLAESLIVITVVATVITVVYAVIMNYYIKQDNEVTKYNTPQGLHNAREIEKLCSVRENYFVSEMDEDNKTYLDITKFDFYINKNLDIYKIYFSKSDISNLIKDRNIPIRIKRFLRDYNNEENKERCQYKYLVIYNDNSYSMIGTMCDK